MRRYDQHEAVKMVLELLSSHGIESTRHLKVGDNINIKSFKNGKTANLLVRHLEKDHAYKNSPLPYQVFKVEAFDDNEERDESVKQLDFVIGYNFMENSFACVPIEEFKDKRSTVVHEKEGNRHQYYNSLFSLEEFFQ
ncbi:hypothetical protein [Metabacillus hrfriensis]|uniref:Uncharacterized protein n=1 Tax=Metabacillus hrfriensis TaxID=3048891 RepID=A0ACD4RHS1_9BACI|nr:hypothetical protein [Metabacillus sp. CT-WN-B3]WHZ60034.1 hypothetical protein QLQ22_12175 [Metabacillus sp. CT-WN-B3]